MKYSGIEWIGTIPEHWSVLKAKYVIMQNDGGVWGDEPIEGLENKIVLRSTEQTIDGKWSILDPATRYLNNVSYKTAKIKKGDLLITKSSGSSLHIGKTTLADEYFDTHECYYSNFLQRIHPNNKILSQYLWYIYNSPISREQFVYHQNSTIGIGNINSTDIENIIVPLPKKEEQCAIIRYLDKRCGEIDAITAEIQEQINTLEEYKKSVISETVTKGLNPNVPMKDSGIEWIGKIPENWKIEKGKYCLSYLQKPVRQTDEVITCFRDGEVTLRKNRREDGFTMSDKEIGYQGIDVGDLIVHGMDGFAGAIGISDSRGKASPVLNVLDTNQNKSFIMYYLRSMAYNGVFIALATGIRVRTCDTNWGKLKELPYPLPSKAEQDRIVDYINEQLSQTNDIIANKQKQIETLEEYKKTLIYEYVTGKKEVA